MECKGKGVSQVKEAQNPLWPYGSLCLMGNTTRDVVGSSGVVLVVGQLDFWMANFSPGLQGKRKSRSDSMECLTVPGEAGEACAVLLFDGSFRLVRSQDEREAASQPLCALFTEG